MGTITKVEHEKPNESNEHLSKPFFTLPNGLSVRPYRIGDEVALQRHANNKKIWDRLRNRMPHPYTLQHAEQWIKVCTDPSGFVSSGPWTYDEGAKGPAYCGNNAITLNDEIIGTIGLEFGDPEDVYCRTAEIGYWLGEEHWRKGIMSAIVPAFVDWTWRTFGILTRLNAEVHTLNVGSRRALEKAGFQEEGKKIKAFVKNGAYGDVILLGLLRPEAW